MNSTSSKKHTLILMPSGRRGLASEGVTVLDAAHELGVEIESICGGRQTCGKCLIEPEIGVFQKHKIRSQQDHLSPPEEAEQAYAQEHGIDLSQRRLACAARIQGDLLVTVPEESQSVKQVIRKEASDLTLTVQPAVKIFYVEVAPASLGGAGDWERVQDALADQWDLQDLKIDPLVLLDLQRSLRESQWQLSVTVWQGRQVIRVVPGYQDRLLGMAFDIGSTTVAGYLCDLRTGEVLATEAAMNPQIRFGEDLMSRVSYAMTEPQGTQRMHRAVIGCVNELAERAAGQAGVLAADIIDLVFVGNTVMHHLLLGINPVELGGAPFALALQSALDIRGRDLGLKVVHPHAMVHVLPCIAGHVGADNVGVLLAELPSLDEAVSLIVDIGTNAEILLGRGDRLLSASSPTGPAFEGAQITHGQRAAPGAIERVRIDPQDLGVRYRVIGDARWSDELAEDDSLAPTGICGSGIVEAVAELFVQGLIDASGLFQQDGPDRCAAIRRAGRGAELLLAPGSETRSGEDLVVTQNDVRAIQLAKGALYAGARILMDELGVERVDRIKLAGAFGSYIDPKYAMLIGMIPDCDLEQVHAIGNAAGDGARIALLNVEQRSAAVTEARKVEYIETAVMASFQDHFVAAMNLPHASHDFPHIEPFLTEQARAAPVKQGRRHGARTLDGGGGVKDRT